MSAREIFYETALRGARPLLRLAAPFNQKLARGLEGRAGAVHELEEWARTERDPERPLAWVHAPSVGEALMAQAIMGALRRERPETQLVFTIFSPSAERVAARVGADLHTWLPWDITSEARRALSALRPDLLAFVRTEIWPIMTREAERIGTRLALVNGALAPGSSRLRSSARYLLEPGYRRLDLLGAVAPGDAERFSLLGVPRERIRVTGDARFDQVWGRIEALGDESARLERPLLRRFHDPDALTIVAGSTWPADEESLVPAFARLRGEAPLRLIIAPHEPTEAHLAGLEERLAAASLRSGRLGELEAGEAPLPEVIVVDRVGVLAELYALAGIAYVGGGFGNAGLHSVIEPAALGVPVIYGPRFGNALEADDLARAGGGWIVSGEDSLHSAMRRLVRNSVERVEASAAARIFVRSRLGGAARNAELLLELLDRPAPVG